jgi:membrane protein DedA with SNARE-associated domain
VPALDVAPGPAKADEVDNSFVSWHVVILLLLLVPAVLALVSIARSRLASSTQKALWVLAVVVAPLLGSVLWFVLGRRTSAGLAR